MNYTEHCSSSFCKGPLVGASPLTCSHNSVCKNQTEDKFGHKLIALGKKHGSDRSQMKKDKGKTCNVSKSPSVFFSVIL